MSDPAVLGPLLAAVAALPDRSVVGLSGFGGAGKTALAAVLADRLPRVAVVAADDFLDPAGCALVTDDWGGLDRDRLRRQVVDPFRRGVPVRWQRHDWVAGPAEWHDLPPCSTLLVEGVGLLHPSFAWDLAVWLDVDPDLALTRAIARDLAQDADVSGWPIWAETDRRYRARFRPDLTADLVISGRSDFRESRSRDARR